MTSFALGRCFVASILRTAQLLTKVEGALLGVMGKEEEAAGVRP